MLKQLHAMEELPHVPLLEMHMYPLLHLDVAQGVSHKNVPEEEEETHHMILANFVLVIVEVQVSREPWESLLTSRPAKHLTRIVPPSRSSMGLESRMGWTSTHRSKRSLRTSTWASWVASSRRATTSCPS